MSFRLPVLRGFGSAAVLAAAALLTGGLRAETAVGADGAPVPVVAEGKGPMSAPEAAGLLHLGSDLAGKGDYATAEIAYRQVLQRRDFSVGDQKTALLGLAHMFRQAGAQTKAAAIYEKFIKEFPDDYHIPDAFLDLGRTLRDMGAYNLALTRFYSVINTTLKLPAQGYEHYILLAKTAQFEIAQTYYESGDFVEAAKFFGRVRLLELAPIDRARAHFMAGCAEAKAKQLSDAVVTLHAFLEQWPNDENVPEARYVLATTLDELKRPQEALAATLELLRAEHSRVAADPKRWAYWQRRTGNQLANAFFQEGDIVSALTVYNGLVAISPDPGWRMPITYQVALCYERLFQTDDARNAYQTVVAAANPKPGEAAPAPEIVELAQMANWRLAHLQWRDGFTRRLTTILSTDGPPADEPAKAVPAPSTPNPPHTS